MKVLKTKRTFRKELKRQMRLAIVAAIGFTIAFAWRNAVFDTFQEYISQLFNVTFDHPLTEVYTAFLITIVGVLIIFITSKFLSEH